MKIDLVSRGYKILSILGFVVFVVLLILVSLYADIYNIVPVLLCSLLVVLSILGMGYCFTHRIVIKEDRLYLKSIFTRVVQFKDIQEVACHNNVIVIKTENKAYLVSGYKILFDKEKQTKNTLEVVNKIHNEIFSKEMM